MSLLGGVGRWLLADNVVCMAPSLSAEKNINCSFETLLVYRARPLASFPFISEKRWSNLQILNNFFVNRMGLGPSKN